MSIGILLFLLLIISAGITAIWRLTRSRKQFTIAISISVLVLFGILFALYLPAYQWYSFTIRDTVISGDNDISYRLPVLGRAHGSYNIRITPINHTNQINSVEARIKSGGQLIGTYFGDSTNQTGPTNIPKAIILDIASRREGKIHISITDDNPPNEYRLWIGRHL